MRLAAVPMEQRLTRDQWIAKYARISLKTVVAVLPEEQSYSLDASWNLIRVGSFWRADEEYHVFAMESAVNGMINHKENRPGADMLVVTPVWVFSRSGNVAAPVMGEEILRTAQQNFMRFFGDLYKRWKTNG